MVEGARAAEIFGEIGVFDGSPRTATAVAEGRVRLVNPRGDFLAALASCPTLGETLCRMLAQRLRRTYELFQDAAFETLEVRLARQVLYLAASEGRATQQGLRLTHRLRQPAYLADLLGATTRSIITILNAWRTAGWSSTTPTGAAGREGYRGNAGDRRGQPEAIARSRRQALVMV